MITGISRRVAQRQKLRADAAIQELRKDLDLLGLGPAPGSVRVALRARYQRAPASWTALLIVGFFGLRSVSKLVAGYVGLYAPEWVINDLKMRAPASALSRAAWLQFARDLIVVGSWLLLVRRVMVLLGVRFRLDALMFTRVVIWVDLIGECADVYRSASNRAFHLRTLSLRYAVMRVYGARSMRGTVSPFSWRRAPLRGHAFSVVAALRAAESRLDIEPREASRELARLLLKISQRYANGQVGALLDPGELTAPARRREALRLCAAVLLVAGVAVCAPLLHIPIPVGVAAAVIAIALVYRSALATGLGLLALLLPLFFPGK
ncbi:hypothetical protein ACIPJQ_03600 [Streptomyces griseoviridis]